MAGLFFFTDIMEGMNNDTYERNPTMFFGGGGRKDFSLPEDVCVAPKLLPASDAPRMEWIIGTPF